VVSKNAKHGFHLTMTMGVFGVRCVDGLFTQIIFDLTEYHSVCQVLIDHQEFSS
jgi:hypothetical protein